MEEYFSQKFNSSCEKVFSCRDDGITCFRLEESLLRILFSKKQQIPRWADI